MNYFLQTDHYVNEPVERGENSNLLGVCRKERELCMIESDACTKEGKSSESVERKS